MGGGSGGGGGWYSPGTMSFGGGSTASALTCTASYAPVSLLCSSSCSTRAVEGGGCLPHVAMIFPAPRSGFRTPSFPLFALASPSHHPHLVSLPSCWIVSSMIWVGGGLHSMVRLCFMSSRSQPFDACVTWQQVPRMCSCGVLSFEVGGSGYEGGGDGWLQTGVVVLRSPSAIGIGLNMRLAAWNLSYLTTLIRPAMLYGQKTTTPTLI